MCPAVPENIVLSKINRWIISVLDRGECFEDREKVVEHSESQYQQRNFLHYYGGVNIKASVLYILMCESGPDPHIDREGTRIFEVVERWVTVTVDSIPGISGLVNYRNPEFSSAPLLPSQKQASVKPTLRSGHALYRLQ